MASQADRSRRKSRYPVSDAGRNSNCHELYQMKGLFSSFVHHIIGQQISTKAQQTIWQRMNDAFGWRGHLRNHWEWKRTKFSEYYILPVSRTSFTIAAAVIYLTDHGSSFLSKFYFIQYYVVFRFKKQGNVLGRFPAGMFLNRRGRKSEAGSC